MKTLSWMRRLLPVSTAQLSAAGRVRLLELGLRGVRYSMTAAPILALPMLGYFALRSRSVALVVLWCVAVSLAAVANLGLRRYLASKASSSPEVLLRRWPSFVANLALAHGVSLGLALALVAPLAPPWFSAVMTVALAGTIASNAAHLTPMFGVFMRFMLATWLVGIVLSPHAFPGVWGYILLLSTAFILAMYMNALHAHRFFVEQVRLEAHSQDLAEQQRQAKEQAEQALRDKSRFLATASHDLRQPVHAMGMLVAAMQAQTQEPGQRALLGDMARSMDALTIMLNALLDLSRLESGEVSQQPSAVSLHALVHEVSALFREQATQRGLSWRLHVPQDATVWADPALLRQVIVNLTHNALRYTSEGGVLLAVRRQAGHWLIEVWDTGVGVATQEQGRIFSPYYRGDRAWQIDNAGHGLGLAVVARCAQLMAMPYGMQSQLGRGSRFWLRLPMHHAPALSGARVALDAGPPSLHGRCLVLDDDPEVLRAWSALLGGWGVQLCAASSATEAHASLDAGFVPDVVLCDQRLRSGESGFEVLQSLLARCPDARGAMVSGEFSSAELAQAEDEGYLVLRKPVAVDTLRDLLLRWLPPNPASAKAQVNAQASAV